MRPALVLMSLCFAILGCKPVEPMSDAEVKAAWEREHETTVKDEYFDVKRSETFKEVAMCGTFAHDYGMKDSGMFVGSTFTDCVNGCEKVLASASWAKAEQGAREKLALAYVTEIYCAWRGYMHSAGDAFENVENKFTAIEVKTVDGKQVVTFWQAGVVGMRPERDYYKLEITIDADGKLVGRKVLEQFTVFF